MHRYYLSWRNPAAPTVLFYPQLPSWRTGIHKILMQAGIGITDDPETSFAIAIFWEDSTFPRGWQQLKEMQKAKKVINYHCTDISKKNIEKVFESVFGYHLRISPESGGKILRKSDFNGKHDGEIIRGPVAEMEEGVVYEKVLNNQLDNGLFEDLRIPYFNGIIPVLSRRFYKKENRFNTISRATLAPVEEHLNREELGLIRRFCEELGFEYGELDLVRDREDQRIYIVDANPTPTLPTSDIMQPALRRKMIRKCSEAFKEAFIAEGSVKNSSISSIKRA